MEMPSLLALRIADAIAGQGHAVQRGFAPATLVAALRARAQDLDAQGVLRSAAVGRGAGRAVAHHTRGDRIGWLDETSPSPEEAAVCALLDDLRLAANRTLALGLFSFEAHYAIYPPGARYVRHRDRFRDDDARVLSFVLYLNDEWHADDGGALRLHLQAGSLDVLPQGGTLATFLSERFEHEVLPAARPRLSLTGWFRRRECGSSRGGC